MTTAAHGAPLSFAAAASSSSSDGPLRTVQIEGHVLLKILKHCAECSPALVTGQLLGLDVGTTLEVTEAFPFPSRAEDRSASSASAATADDDGASYQLDMMRCLREVNADNNTVGWYQSTALGAYQSQELADTFAAYASTIRRAVCIVCDPDAARGGGSGIGALRAVKLKDSFVAAHRSAGGSCASLGAAALKAAKVTWRDVFEEVPVSVRNSPLAVALARSILPAASVAGTLADEGDAERLDLAAGPASASAAVAAASAAAAVAGGNAASFLSSASASATNPVGGMSSLGRCAEYLSDCLDDLGQEAQRLSYYHRALARAQQAAATAQARRRQENAARRAAGEPLLPEEDETTVLKAPPEPSPLEGFLVTSQISGYCDRLGAGASGTLRKLQMLEGLERAGGAAAVSSATAEGK